MQRFCYLFVVLLACIWIVPKPLAAQTLDALNRPALAANGSEHSVLLDITKTGNRIVAAGERGVIVYSDNSGGAWRQAATPVSVTLTKVKFATPLIGWAVGHSGVVLHTADGGATWTRQLDGNQAAQLALDAAQSDASHASSANAQRALTDAQRLVSDGPDKPFLDLYFANDKTGYVVGAYGLIFRTDDGGANWKCWMSHVDNPRGMHIYAIAAQGQTLYLAGEQGLFLRSTDGGEKFSIVKTPYNGTYFTTLILPTGEIVLGGMRGNVFRSADQGKSFTKVDSPIPVSLSAAVVMADGLAVFANQAGTILTSNDRCQTLRPAAAAGLPPIAGLADAGNGMLMTVGYGGIIPLPLNAMHATAKNGGAQ